MPRYSHAETRVVAFLCPMGSVLAVVRIDGPLTPDWFVMTAPVWLVLAMRAALRFIVFGVSPRKPRYRYKPYRP